MFLGEVCRDLGISVMAYKRLEWSGKVPKAQRREGIGGTMVRVFKKRDLARLKTILDSRRPSPLTESRGADEDFAADNRGVPRQGRGTHV